MMSQKEAPSFLRAYCMYLCYRMRYSWGIPQGFLWDSQGLFDNSCWITGELLGYSWVFLGEPGVFLGETGASQGIHVDFLGASQYFCYFIENNWELSGSFLWAFWELPRSFLEASSELPRSFLGASWELPGASWERLEGLTWGSRGLLSVTFLIVLNVLTLTIRLKCHQLVYQSNQIPAIFLALAHRHKAICQHWPGIREFCV